jgi:hypothetical protein
VVSFDRSLLNGEAQRFLTEFFPPIILLLTPLRHGNAGKTLFAQFTKVQSIHRGFYK